jgi:hypothetical protein
MKKILAAIALLLGFSSLGLAQLPSQVKQVLPNTPTVNFSWDYNTADEASIDSFVLQRTDFASTTTITSPYSTEIVITQKTMRTATFTIPAGVLAGQKAFFRLVARKVGLADSAPSNVVEVDIVPTPPSPTNFRFP